METRGTYVTLNCNAISNILLWQQEMEDYSFEDIPLEVQLHDLANSYMFDVIFMCI